MADKIPDFLRDFYNSLTKEQKAGLGKDNEPVYYWKPVEESLLRWSPQASESWNPQTNSWEDDPEAVEVMLGESFGRTIDAAKAEEYKVFLNQKHGKTSGKIDDSIWDAPLN